VLEGWRSEATIKVTIAIPAKGEEKERIIAISADHNSVDEIRAMLESIRGKVSWNLKIFGLHAFQASDSNSVQAGQNFEIGPLVLPCDWDGLDWKKRQEKLLYQIRREFKQSKDMSLRSGISLSHLCNLLNANKRLGRKSLRVFTAKFPLSKQLEDQLSEHVKFANSGKGAKPK